MKAIEKVLELLCVVLTIVFFLAVTVMVLGQAVCIFGMNGQYGGRGGHDSGHDSGLSPRTDEVLKSGGTCPTACLEKELLLCLIC